MSRKAGEGFIASASRILNNATRPMTCLEIVERATTAGLLDSRGKTPRNTLHALLSRDIRDKGENSQFRKSGAGKFTLAKKLVE